MRSSKIWACASLFALALLLPKSAPAGLVPPEFENWFVPLPGFVPNTFTLILKGDQTGVIPAQIASDALTNPFAVVNPGTASVTVTKDGSGNTDIVYSGSSIPLNTTFPYGSSPHFGLNNGIQPPGGFQVLSETWSAGASTLGLNPLSIITATQNLAAQSTFQFLTIFAQVGGIGTWLEVPIIPGQPPTFQLTNNNGTPLTLSNVGFMISPTQIPLDQLNFTADPPPGSPGSTFTPLPSLDGMTLAPGTTINASVVPEPAAVLGLAQGLIGLAGFLSIQAARRRTAKLADPGT